MKFNNTDMYQLILHYLDTPFDSKCDDPLTVVTHMPEPNENHTMENCECNNSVTPNSFFKDITIGVEVVITSFNCPHTADFNAQTSRIFITERFLEPEDFKSALFHELVHSTMMPHYLGRPWLKNHEDHTKRDFLLKWRPEEEFIAECSEKIAVAMDLLGKPSYAYTQQGIGNLQHYFKQMTGNYTPNFLIDRAIEAITYLKR